MTATTRDEIDVIVRFCELHADATSSVGDALLMRKAADMLRALRDQREETIAKLADPAAVVANMMRGHIAKPDFRAFLSIYGEVFNDLEAANIANIELRDQREADARTCVWSPDDDEYCPGTWDGACGAKWTFTEGGVVDNDMHYCPQCGGKVTVAAMPAQGEK